MRVPWGILAVVVAALAAGCFVGHHHGHPHGGPPGLTKKMVVHAHGFDCGHFYADGVWVVLPVGHMHGPGCGHVAVHGRWHVAKAKGPKH